MEIKLKNIKSAAKNILLGNYGQLMLAVAMYILIPTSVVSLFESAGAGPIVSYVVSTIMVVIQGILSAGLSLIALSMARMGFGHFRMLFAPFKYTDKFFFLSVINAMAGYFPFLPAAIFVYISSSEGGLDSGNFIIAILLIILGFALAMYLTVALSVSRFVMIDKPMTPVIECVKKSVELIKGQKVKMLQLQLSFIGWFLLGMFSLGVGMLWVMPYYYETMAVFYRQLRNEQQVFFTVSVEGLKPDVEGVHDWGVVTDDTPLSSEVRAEATETSVVLETPVSEETVQEKPEPPHEACTPVTPVASEETIPESNGDSMVTLDDSFFED